MIRSIHRFQTRQRRPRKGPRKFAIRIPMGEQQADVQPRARGLRVALAERRDEDFLAAPQGGERGDRIAVPELRGAERLPGTTGFRMLLAEHPAAALDQCRGPRHRLGVSTELPEGRHQFDRGLVRDQGRALARERDGALLGGDCLLVVQEHAQPLAMLDQQRGERTRIT
ncbi:MAG: hypothetical protein DYH17_02730 [Xanthomonadales bacterium PRO6]|nr:hypothetical protein [Xanthomonadales bacterium PRO6]